MKGDDVKRIREGLKMSQAEFAGLLNVSVKTLQNWEQDRNEPNAAAIALLRLAESGRLDPRKK